MEWLLGRGPGGCIGPKRRALPFPFQRDELPVSMLRASIQRSDGQSNRILGSAMEVSSEVAVWVANAFFCVLVRRYSVQHHLANAVSFNYYCPSV